MSGILPGWSTFWIVIASIAFFVPAGIGWIVLFIDWGIKTHSALFFILGSMAFIGFGLVVWPFLIVCLAFLFVVGCLFIVRFLLTEEIREKTAKEGPK